MNAAEPPAYRMRGPAAFAGSWRRFANLAVMLAFTEYKLRFFDSVLGYLWTLVRPLLLFGILYFVFSQVLDVDAGIAFYPALLLMGMVLFQFFAEATGGAVRSVIERENLVRKVQFPRMIIPLSVSLTSFFNLIGNFVAIFVFIAASGVEVRWTWLEVPFLILMLFVFALGLSMLLSALYVPFRDVQPIWEVLLQALFYATPVLYPIELLAREQPDLAEIAMCNPLAVIIQQVRYAMIDPNAQSAGDALGDGTLLLIPAVIVVGTFVLGLWVFNRLAPRIAEEL
jgi:ABC-2 type transport system permease protein